MTLKIVSAVLLLTLGQTVFSMEQVADTRFSADRGFYSAATNVIISSDTATATITYTLDGSDPRSSSSAISGSNPAVVSIDPDDATGKWKATPAVMLRAYAHQSAMAPSNVDTHTYIFPSEVKSQGDIRPSGSYVFWKTTEMDPEIVNDGAYSGELDEALLSLPSLSIVMDHDDLFGAEGIHRGDNLTKDWEMPCSMELIYPDTPRFIGFKGFQIDCGIKNQGGGGLWDNGEYDHKQSFGIRFRRQYGAGSLNYPFFEHAPLNADSEAGVYDKLILRAGHNKSYGIDYDAAKTVYTRDQLARDLQIDLSGIGGHGSFVHLYLNGIYWGLYNPCERQDNAFAASYLGGNEEDYYCGKAKGGDTSGNNSRYNEWLNTASKSSNLDTLLAYCDISKHADMCLINSYASVGDYPQYYYGVGNNPNGQVHLFNWDAEDAFGGGSKRSSNNPDMGILSATAGFNNMWNNNLEYRVKFADRAYRACFNGGALTDDHVLERWNSLCDSIYSAMICESARWGDERVSNPRERDDEWAAARAAVAAGTVGKANRLINALISAGKYPSTRPPLFKHAGSTITKTSLDVSSGYSLTLERDGSSGTIYYTLDGSDPRAVGGGVQGVNAGSSATISINATTLVKARTLAGGTWSALREVVFFVPRDLSDLKFTEIMYNPEDGLMAAGAAVQSIIGDAGAIDPSYVDRALVEFSSALPAVLTGGDKVKLSGASNPTNNGTFTIAKVIFEGSIGQTRTKKVLLTKALSDESSGGVTGDFLYDGDRYEFIEIKNTGATPLPLHGVTFTRGVRHTFPNGSSLAAGAFAVLARNPADFSSRHPSTPIFGSFEASSLDNSGERLELALGTGARHEVLSTFTNAGLSGVTFADVPSNIGPGDRMRLTRSSRYGDNQLLEIQSVLGDTVYVKETLAVGSHGATAYFFDVITSVEYGDSDPWPLPADGYGFSLVPTNANPTGDQNLARAWRASTNAGGSPGSDDPAPQTAHVKVNEALAHTDQPQRDTIELRNPTGQAVDLGGWYLTDDEDLPRKWTIPTGTIIPANGYVVFYEGHYVSNILEFDDDEFGSAFSLSATGDDIHLFSPSLGYSHGFSFEGSYNGVAFGRHVTSQGEERFPAARTFTPMADNTDPITGPIVISEIMYNPSESGHEFIELLNISSQTVPLRDPANPSNTWKVGGVGFQFPATDLALAPGEVLLLARDTITPEAFRTAYDVPAGVQIFSYAGKLDNGGESITLRAPDEPVQSGPNIGEIPFVVIDRVSYDDAAPWPISPDGTGHSLERISAGAYGNDVANWRASAVSGGSPGVAEMDPAITDDDLDGMNDQWELDYFNSTNHPNGNPEDDFDLDGLTNLGEYIAGTNPTNSASVLEFSSVEALPIGIVLKWDSVPNRLYQVSWSESLDSAYQPLGPPIPHPQGCHTDTTHTVKNSSYYKLHVDLEE